MAPEAVVQRSPDLTDTLCTQCGLCCDGTLFADVELTGQAEATRLEILGLEVEDHERNASVLSLPCAALRGTRCGIYAHRPKCCRTFECQLLQDVRRGAVTVARAEEHISDALRKIQGVRELLVQLGQPDVRLPLKERCAEALAGDAGASNDVNRKRAQLDDAMAGVERVIWQTFLGSGRPQRRSARRATPRVR